MSSLAPWSESTTDQHPVGVVFHPGSLLGVQSTTNGMERLSQELKRRTRVVRIFPNRAACLRLVTALAMEQSDEWVSGRR